MTIRIPDRSTSKYFRQYAEALDPRRLAEIFSDSHRIAMTSKIPATAADRFALAVEAYHQLRTLGISGSAMQQIHDAMLGLAERFPAQVLVNEALGLRERARKLKTLRKKRDLLAQAAAVLDRGARDEPEHPVLVVARAELSAEAALLESAADDA